MRRNLILVSVGTILIFSFLTPGSGVSDPHKMSRRILGAGDLLPSFSFSNRFNPEEKAYLGVGDKAILSLADIQAEVLVIKYLNSNCLFCIKSLPAFSTIFQMVDQDLNLSKRIKMMGIGAGDTSTEVATLKKLHAVPFPILPDPEFTGHKAVNEPTVPFVVIAKKDEQGKWVVAAIHVGMTFSAEGFVGELKAILEADPEALKRN